MGINVSLSMLSKFRSFIGFEISHNGYLKKDNDGSPVLVRTIVFGIGFLFGFLEINFDTGSKVRLEDINKSLMDEVSKGKRIG